MRRTPSRPTGRCPSWDRDPDDDRRSRAGRDLRPAGAPPAAPADAGAAADGAGHVRRPDPRASARSPARSAARSAPTRGCATCGSRARSAGSRSRPPGTPTSRSRTSAASSSASGSATTALRSAFEPQAGLRVVAHGRIDLFEPQGALQLYVDSIQPAGLRRPRPALRGAQGAARGRGPVRRRPQAAAAVAARDDRGHHQPDRRRLAATSATSSARRWPLARVVLVACQVQGDGAPASIVDGVPPARALDRASAAREGRPDEAPGGHDPGPRRRLARGPVGVQRRARRAGGRRPPGAGRVRRRPRGRRDAGRLRRRRPGADARPPRPRSSCPTGPRSLAALRRAGATAATAPRRRAWRPRRARSPPSGGRSTGSARRPSSPSARERVGLLLDRATRALGGAGSPAATRARDRRPRAGSTARGSRPGVRLARAGDARRRRRRRSAVLGPQATLERGYAIVRRAADGGDRPRPGRGAGRDAPRGPRRRRRAAPRPSTRDRSTTRAGDRRSSSLAVAIVAVVGIALGMLVAPRLDAPDRAATTRSPVTDDEPTRDRRRDRAPLTFDEALAELQRTVAELEAGGQPLEAVDRAVRARRRPPASAASGCSPTRSCASSSSSRGPAAPSRRATCARTRRARRPTSRRLAEADASSYVQA